MENKINPWKANLTNGLILGLIGIIYSLVVYFLDLSFNKVQGYIFIVVQIGILYYLVKSYRDNFLHGNITFGQAVGAGVIICLYYSIISAVFTYILYAFIDPDLVGKQLAFTEEMLQGRNIPQEAIDVNMRVQKKLMIPEVIAPLSIAGNMFWGVIISLITAIFVRKEGNPLLDPVDSNL